MTDEDAPLSSKEELNEALKSVLFKAYKSGVNVEGGFECRNGAEHPDWDVIVAEVEKNDVSE